MQDLPADGRPQQDRHREDGCHQKAVAHVLDAFHGHRLMPAVRHHLMRRAHRRFVVVIHKTTIPAGGMMDRCQAIPKTSKRSRQGSGVSKVRYAASRKWWRTIATASMCSPR